jgi:transcriptional regulator with XRE-family HTH domain
MEREVLQIIGATIRRLREQTGLSQEAFAQAADLDRSFYGRVERGTQNIALTTLCIVAGTLKVHPRELLDDLNEPDYIGLKPSRRRQEVVK